LQASLAPEASASASSATWALQAGDDGPEILDGRDEREEVGTAAVDDGEELR